MEATFNYGALTVGELRTAKMLFDLVSSKLSKALRQTTSALVHGWNLGNCELTTPQCLALALLHSLQTADFPFCALLLQLPGIESLKSSYVSVWLRDEFNFDEAQVVTALTSATQLNRTGCLNIPEHILQLLSALVTKYHVYEHCRNSGDLDTIKLLEELTTPVSRGLQTDFDATSNSVSEKQSTSNAAIPNSTIGTFNDDTNVISLIEVNLETEAPPYSRHTAREDLPTCSNCTSDIPRDSNINMIKKCLENLPVPLANDLDVIVGGYVVIEGEEGDTSSVGETHDLTSEISGKLSTKDGFAENTSSECTEIVNSPSPEDLDVIVGGFVVIEGEEGDLSSTGETHDAASPEGIGDNDLIRIGRRQRRIQELCSNVENTVQDLTPARRPRLDVQVNLTPGDIAVIQSYVWSPGANHADLVMLATNKRDYMGNTLLHRAAEKGRWADVRTLVKLRNMVDLRNDLCKTPAHLAAVSGSVESLKILVDHGASLSATTDEGYTLLHEAAKHGQTDAVGWLLENGADIEARNRQGDTPLHTAVIWCRLDTVHLLLSRGAHINLKNSNGQTPLALAVLSRCRKIRALLKSKGGIK